MRALRIDENSLFRRLIGVGGIGSGVFFALEGNHPLGREESRPGARLDVRDYCKLHIVIHYMAKLLGSHRPTSPFTVLPVANVGDDVQGTDVLREMSEAGIDTRLVRTVAGKPTLFSVCFQYPDGKGGNITTSNSAAAALSKTQVDETVDLLGGGRTIALAVPEVPLDIRRHFLALATGAGAFRAASFVSAEVSAARDSGMFSSLDLVSLNTDEASKLVGNTFCLEKPQNFVEACLNFLCNEYPTLGMVVTAGRHGAYAFADGKYNHCAAPEVRVQSTAGAGDSLLGGVLAAMAAGIPLLRPANKDAQSIETALEFGVLLASYKCLSPHTIHPSAGLTSLTEFARDVGRYFSPAFEELFIETSRPAR